MKIQSHKSAQVVVITLVLKKNPKKSSLSSVVFSILSYMLDFVVIICRDLLVLAYEINEKQVIYCIFTTLKFYYQEINILDIIEQI